MQLLDTGITRSYDPAVMRDACYEQNGEFDYEGWVRNPNNLMYVAGDDVGLLVYEYPGLYTGHWFFVSRGKQALDTAFAILDIAFEKHGAKAIRGITPVHLKAARYLAKRLGFVSVDILDYPDEQCDLMILTKSDFTAKKKERYG